MFLNVFFMFILKSVDERLYIVLDLRHEASLQSERGRQRRGRSSISKSFFLLIASLGHSLAAKSSQSGRPGATRAGKSSQPGRPEQPDRARRSQIEPARASQERPEHPNRASQGACDRQVSLRYSPS